MPSGSAIPLFQLRTQGKLRAREPRINAQAPAGNPAYNPTYQEFYCQSGGSNLNSGTDQSNSPKYATTNGNWSISTLQFIPTNGTNPVDSGVKAGDWVSIYTDGASVTVFVALVTSVVNAVNGAITVAGSTGAAHTAGTAPTTSATGRSLRCGGAWRGPNGSTKWPLDASVSWSNATDAVGNYPRINIKNDTTYTVTTSLNFTGALAIVQGYSETPGDQGRATINFGTTSGVTTLFTSGTGQHVISDLVLLSSATAGNDDLWGSSNQHLLIVRVTASGARGCGFRSSNSDNYFEECEAYNCLRSGSSAAGGAAAGFSIGTVNYLLRCISVANFGSGFGSLPSSGSMRFENCIAHRNFQHGFLIGPTTAQTATFYNCDAYANSMDGYSLQIAAGQPFISFQSCNALANGRAGIFCSTSGVGKLFGWAYNCGFGSGSKANFCGNLVNVGMLRIINPVTYAPDTTPYLDPDVAGNFQIVSTQALGAGRGYFTQSQGGFSGTAGFPDIGAAQHPDSVVDSGSGFASGF